jgi:hypothetical protein
MSPTASVKSTDQEQGARLSQLIKENDEYEDAERNNKPKSPNFWAILIGMYLSISL